MFIKYIAHAKDESKKDVRLINADKVIIFYLHEYSSSDSRRLLIAETDVDQVYHLGVFPNAYIAKRELENISKAIEANANLYTISYT